MQKRRLRAFNVGKEVFMENDRFEKPVRGLRKRLKNLHHDPAAAEIHNLRTRAREIEVVAGALKGSDGKARRVLKAIKPVRKAAGGVRDLDVLTADAMSLAGETDLKSMTRLVDSLIAMREKSAAELVKVVERKHKRMQRRLKRFGKRLNEEFAEGESGTRDSVRAAIEKLTGELKKWPALSARNIHRFRLRLKELLALLQLEADSDAGFARAMRHAKKQIGEWHDWQKLREMAGEILDARRDRALLARISKVVESRLAKALAASNALRGRFLRSALRRNAA